MSTLLTEEHLADVPMIDEEDADDMDSRIGSASIALPPSPPPSRLEDASDTISTPHFQSRVLRRLLAIADSYYHGGSLHQAIELYFELFHDHAGTPQAAQAEERLLEVARTHERAGELRQARGIYERLI